MYVFAFSHVYIHVFVYMNKSYVWVCVCMRFSYSIVVGRMLFTFAQWETFMLVSVPMCEYAWKRYQRAKVL